MLDPSEIRIPTPRAALAAIISAASDPTVSVGKLGRLVSTDPGFAAQVLKLVNSPMFRRNQTITSTMRAVAVLGSRALRNVALCTATRNCVRKRDLGGLSLDRFWEASVQRAAAARILAARDEICDPMEAFTMGLLLDMGVLALVQTKPETGTQWMEAMGWDPERRLDLEKGLFGYAHPEIGKVIADAWALPDELAIPMIFHHAPESAPEQWRERCRLAQRAEIVGAVLGAQDKRKALERAREVVGKDGGIEDLLSSISNEVTAIGNAMGFRITAQPTLEEILLAANESLIEMNLSYEDIVRKLEETISQKEKIAAELEVRNRQLEQLSVTDELTSLSNRRAFVGRLAYDVTRLSREGGALSLLIMDIDHFKKVNDTWGHDFGDEVLRQVSAALGGGIRKSDLLARVGGEEFAVLLPATAGEGALIVGEKLRNCVGALTFRTPTGESYRPTISVGHALLVGPERTKFDPDAVGQMVYRAADQNLYKSKRGGRNRCTLAKRELAFSDVDAAEAA